MDEIERRGLGAAAARGRGARHAAPRHLHRHAGPVRGERGARPPPRPRPAARAACAASTTACRCRTWAGTACAPRRPHPLLEGVADGAHVYFVHSYYCDARRRRGDRDLRLRPRVRRPSWAGATCSACSSIPEKSQAVGLRLIANFVAAASPRGGSPKSAPSEGARMIVVPAIDLRGGKVVRLQQGRASRRPSTAPTPRRRRAAGRAEGAARLHVVDLDAAIERQAAVRRASRRSSRAVRDPGRGGRRPAHARERACATASAAPTA